MACEMELETGSSAVEKQISETKTRETECESQQPSSDKAAILPQVAGTAAGALAQLGIGIIGGFSGVMLPQLTDVGARDIVLDEHQVALFSSLVYLGAAVGCLVWTLPMAWMGQRWSMLVHLPVFLAASLALAFAPSVWLLQTSRFLLGVSGGVIEAASYSYVTELAHNRVRGKLVGTADTMRQLGVLIVYILGSTGLSWRKTALICGCVTTIPVGVGLLLLPNSPRWLATRGRMDECKESLAFFRGAQYDCSSEMEAIISQTKDDDDDGGRMLQQIRRMKEPQTLKIFGLLAFLMFSVQFTGNIVVVSYVVPIFNAAKVNISSYMSAIVIATVRIMATVFSLSVVDRLGRRPALITAFLLCSGSLFLLGTFFFLQKKGVSMGKVSWFPVLMMVVYAFVSCVGHPVLNLVRGELLPTAVRNAANSLLFFIFFCGMFVVSHSYPATVSTLGEEGAFWVYGGVCLVIVAAVVFFIPETRGKVLENIAEQEQDVGDYKTRL
ncbi:facilitated trehalose transporter Tret1-like [Penaeus chinensis]|uniref:facilitated trehalose transporter Tret1-like n=1 Tax=Penaeus chinensis TaxID=139456 RepID=UPI001FB57BFF|nr:facilitated trehalose transporter Tret1-like [Penaeus chinensis]XP_047471885.1 facilitated trehalose transporter Tret1-like [Penaeus chinensis]XP_047471894.1 facilitated trehalose transporter Tret1-like [Penaeus chinensis]